MDDLKIIFYIVVALFWLVLRNYRKVQQNKPGGPAPEPVAESVQVPEEPGAGSLRKPKMQRPRPVRVKSPVPEPSGTGPAYTFDALRDEAQPVTDFFAAQAAVRQEPAAIVHPEPAFQAGNFDLRTAVIHAEILKRPDW